MIAAIADDRALGREDLVERDHQRARVKGAGPARVADRVLDPERVDPRRELRGPIAGAAVAAPLELVSESHGCQGRVAQYRDVRPVVEAERPRVRVELDDPRLLQQATAI